VSYIYKHIQAVLIIMTGDIFVTIRVWLKGAVKIK